MSSPACSTQCLIRSGGALYSLPAASICEVLDWQAPVRVPLVPEYVAGVILYQGDVLTVVELSYLVGQNASSTAAALVVLEDPQTGERFALAVEAVERVASIPEADLEPVPPTFSPVVQAIFQGLCRSSGELVILLNLTSLVPESLFDRRDSSGDAEPGEELCAR